MKKKIRLKKRAYIILTLCVLLIVAGTVAAAYGIVHITSELTSDKDKTPESAIKQYITYLNEKKYDKMYAMLAEKSQKEINKEDFIERNKNIYEGIEAENIAIKLKENEDPKAEDLFYTMTMDSLAGEISFDNQAFFKEEDGKWRLLWTDSIIYPDLQATDKVTVTVLEAKRGNIYDRNGVLLAGEGAVSSVGLVPGKMSTDPQADLQKLASLLNVSVDSIQKNLSASWVKEDSFVPIRRIDKKVLPVNETGQAPLDPLTEQLMEIPGVMMTDETRRSYPLGAKAAHLTGYVQGINADELEELQDSGYTEDSMIGKSGLENLYEKRLRPTDGCKIAITNKEGIEKQILATKSASDGNDITLTIDADLQSFIYDQFAEDKSCTVALNPMTGEVLALVSTPSFDSNDFILGMPQEKWNALNTDKKKPLYNRFKAVWCPGSSFKPIVAAIGLTTGTLDAAENLGYSGKSWQKDTSWGDYKVTTLKDYGSNAVLQNALIYSDNIYFAKAALKIGQGTLTEQLDKIGFGSKIPFAIRMTPSQYANKGTIESEIQLADTGYGQGQLLLNPLHLATIYTAFLNDGNIVKPYLEYKTETEPEYWVEQAFTTQAAQIVRDDLVQTISNPQGTGHRAKIDEVTLAGKTGTAEIKASKEDVGGTELGWFAAFPTNASKERAVLIVSMVEDVKDCGGSNYVVDKDKLIFKKLYGDET